MHNPDCCLFNGCFPYKFRSCLFYFHLQWIILEFLFNIFLVFCSPVLIPNFNLLFCQLEIDCELFSLHSNDIVILFKCCFQHQKLNWSECCSCSFPGCCCCGLHGCFFPIHFSKIAFSLDEGASHWSFRRNFFLFFLL